VKYFNPLPAKQRKSRLMDRSAGFNQIISATKEEWSNNMSNNDTQIPRNEQNQITDQSSDRKYFLQRPAIVKLKSRDLYDIALWDTVKEIAGDNGECFINTLDLAAMSMMSAGKVADSRKYLIKIGLLEGKMKRRSKQGRPLWHLRIPDLWLENATVMSGISFADKRDAYRNRDGKQPAFDYLQEVSSQDEQIVNSPHESVNSPHESTLSGVNSCGETEEDLLELDILEEDPLFGDSQKTDDPPDKEPNEPVIPATPAADAVTSNQQSLFNLLLEICYNGDAGRGPRCAIGKLAKRKRDKWTAKQLGIFKKWWASVDWRGQKGQTPKPSDVEDMLATALKWNADGQPEHGGNQNGRSEADRRGFAEVGMAGTTDLDVYREAARTNGQQV